MLCANENTPFESSRKGRRKIENASRGSMPFSELSTGGPLISKLRKPRYKSLETLRGSESGLWTTFPKQPPFGDFDQRIARRRPTIITVANNKGGVGKTTIVGNLLAYFDRQQKKKVLVIDLDYQGSLSTMLRLEQDQTEERRSNVNALLKKGAGLGALFEATRKLGERLPRSELASAFYELGLLEDRLMVEWLLQEGGDDVRYRLASVLLQDGIASKYDVILIDVPPRLTTGTINALCASTHVLVPTILNPIAAEPVANFIGTAKGLMDQLIRSWSFSVLLSRWRLMPMKDRIQELKAAE